MRIKGTIQAIFTAPTLQTGMERIYGKGNACNTIFLIHSIWDEEWKQTKPFYCELPTYFLNTITNTKAIVKHPGGITPCGTLLEIGKDYIIESPTPPITKLTKQGRTFKYLGHDLQSFYSFQLSTP